MRAAAAALVWRTPACGSGGLVGGHEGLMRAAVEWQRRQQRGGGGRRRAATASLEVSCVRQQWSNPGCGGLMRAAAMEESCGCSGSCGKLLGRDP
jgi:hypothetical protein